MRFIARSLFVVGFLCLCAATSRGAPLETSEPPDDEVFITDMPGEAVPDEATKAAAAADASRRPSPLRAVAEDSAAELTSPAADVKFEPYEFDGILPGASTIEDVRQVWGEPLGSRRDSGFTVYNYAREPFAEVQAAVVDGQVHSIVVRLRERFAEREVAEQLQLAEFEPVAIFEQPGVCREKAYPERGVTLRGRFDQSADAESDEFQVAEIEFGEVQSQLFLLRAQARLGRNESGALDDLDSALAFEPRLAPAWECKTQILADAGRLADAKRTVETALARLPNNPELRLLRAKLRAVEGDYDAALAEMKELLAQSARPAVFRARVLLETGRLLAEGPAADFKEPIAFYQQAIKLVEPAVDDPQANVRRVACETLVEAHWAMAYAIAWGRWKMKETAVAKWLERGDALANAAIENGDLAVEYELRSCQAALAAQVGVQGTIDPEASADRALEVGRVLVAQSQDPLSRQRLQWQLGLICHDALQILETRQELDSALRFGKLAVAYLEQGRPGRQETRGEAYMLGRLYYRMGSLHARGLGEHDEAVAWYERAWPLLDRPAGASAEPGRRGEELATAAISYWNANQRDKAVAMTAQGVKLLEQAVAKGDVEKAALAVPYANLAAMHEQLGDRVQAASYSEQAASAKTEPPESQ